MGDIDSKIYSARKSLRNIYGKYSKELYDITLKIDQYLETLEKANIKKDEEIKGNENLER